MVGLLVERDRARACDLSGSEVESRLDVQSALASTPARASLARVAVFQAATSFDAIHARSVEIFQPSFRSLSLTGGGTRPPFTKQRQCETENPQ
jgi:hypothetical protein